MRFGWTTSAALLAASLTAPSAVRAQYPVGPAYRPAESAYAQPTAPYRQRLAAPPDEAVVYGEFDEIHEGGPVPYGEFYGSGPAGLGYPGVISNGGGDQLYPYDQQDPWLHGYFQEIPAYGGYAHFRPYNYKHVLSQSQTAGGWGTTPTMPYSQQFWHRYRQRAALMQQAGEAGATEYARELARRQAERDFDTMRRRQPPRPLAAPPRSESENVTAGYLRPAPASNRDAELERLRWEVDEQRARIRDLQRQLEERRGSTGYGAGEAR